jgi:hypothetical protein
MFSVWRYRQQMEPNIGKAFQTHAVQMPEAIIHINTEPLRMTEIGKYWFPFVTSDYMSQMVR